MIISRQLSGAVAAWSVSVVSLLILLNPDPMLRAGLALVVPAVVWLAFAGTGREGSCPSCGRQSLRPGPTESQPKAQPASRTENGPGGVRVRIGWTVTVTDAYSCERCGHTWQVMQDTFIDRGNATTAAEALLLATNRVSS